MDLLDYEMIEKYKLHNILLGNLAGFERKMDIDFFDRLILLKDIFNGGNCYTTPASCPFKYDCGSFCYYGIYDVNPILETSKKTRVK